MCTIPPHLVFLFTLLLPWFPWPVWCWTKKRLPAKSRSQPAHVILNKAALGYQILEPIRELDQFSQGQYSHKESSVSTAKEFVLEKWASVDSFRLSQLWPARQVCPTTCVCRWDFFLGYSLTHLLTPVCACFFFTTAKLKCWDRQQGTRNTASPLCLPVPHPWVQPNTVQKYLKCFICPEHA